MATAMQDAGAKAILQLTYSGAGANYYGVNHKVYGPSKLKLHLPFEHEVEELSHEMIDVIKQKIQRCYEKSDKSRLCRDRNIYSTKANAADVFLNGIE